MTRIICIKCKNAYLQKTEDKFICPSCGNEFSCEEENLLLGAQYYNEGDYSSAKDFLMKYIVKNGAEPRAIIYKALCDGFDFDEDTITLKPTYEKIHEALSDIDNSLFPQYLAVANDETEKLEKALAKKHINLFAEADAEKIKKEVTTIIGIQNDAKAFRTSLTELADKFNESSAEIQLSLKLSKSFLVEPDIAAEVGQIKYEKILENIASHTVFTGILSTEIKNLEIYYRCIVMFFEKNRQKYDFLMASAEKFSQLSDVLAQGQYNTIKGTSTIGDKLKSAAYDFFQESLKDLDGDFDTQEDSVVIIDIKPETEETEEVQELEDISSNTLDSENTSIAENSDNIISEETTEATEKEATQVVDLNSVPKETEDVTEDDKISENETEVLSETEVESAEISETAESVNETEVDIEDVSVEEIKTEVLTDSEDETEQSPKIPEEISEPTIAIEPIKETDEVKEPDDAPTQETKVITVADVAVDVESKEVESKFRKISDEKTEKEVEERISKKKEKAPKPPRKKSYAPIVTGLVLVIGILAIIGFAVVPKKLNEVNYAKAKTLAQEKNYAEAAEIYEKLGDYEDSSDLALQCKYDYAVSLESEKEFEIARDVYKSLGDFKDSKAKIDSCTYNLGLAKLDKKEYDVAISVFESIPNYADSAKIIEECRYQKAGLLLEAKDYAGAIDVFESLNGYSDSKTKINEAKYAFVKDNLDKENSTTMAYLTDLVKAKYKDSVDIRNKLLGKENDVQSGVSHSITYSETSDEKDLKEADNTKPIYFHVTVNEKSYYDKKLTAQFTTSMGYRERKSVVLTADKNTYTLMYPSTGSENYTVEFKLLGSDNATLAEQTITIK